MNTSTIAEIILHLVNTNPEFAAMLAACKTPQEMAIKANLAISKMLADGKIQIAA